MQPSDLTRRHPGKGTVVMDADPGRASRDSSLKADLPESPIRSQDIPRLSRGEFLRLACRAADASLGRLQDIARNTDPHDRPLLRFLERIISEEEDQARFINNVSRAEPSTGPRRINETVINLTLRGYFVSHQCPFGEGFLNRDAAMYFAESCTQELSHFYRRLSDHAPDGVLAKTFREIAEIEEGNLEFIRTVIL